MGALHSLPTLPTNLPIDWIIIAVLIVIFAIDAIRSGAQKECILALSAGIAYVLYQFLPHAAYLETSLAGMAAPLTQGLIFLALVVISAIVIMRIGLSFGDEVGKPIQAVLVGLATTAILLTFWLQIPSLQGIWHFGPQLQYFFADQYKFFWLVGGYIVLAIARA